MRPEHFVIDIMQGQERILRKAWLDAIDLNAESKGQYRSLEHDFKIQHHTILYLMKVLEIPVIEDEKEED